jgi:prephenate dehydratase
VIRVAFQGELGAFSELAIAQVWNGDAEPVPCREFADVIDAVTRGAADAGVLPVENSIIGAIVGARAALDAAAATITITGEATVAVDPLLLASPDTTLSHVREVASHPAALGQCAAFLARHPEWRIVAAYDTAGAARDLQRAPDPARAVIASAAAAQRYGLHALHTNVADRAGNTTRFVTIRRGYTFVNQPSQDDRR